MRTKVVGVSFINDDGSNRANIISKMDENSKVFLERDPYNQYDSNAVKVLVIQDGEKKQIGFLGKDMASSRTTSSSISTKMKSGTQYDVSVVACGEYMDRPFCEINVEEKDAITQKDDNTVAAPRRHILCTTQQPTKPKPAYSTLEERIRKAEQERIRKAKEEAKKEVPKTPTPTNDNPKKQSGGCFGIVILTFVAVSFLML